MEQKNINLAETSELSLKDIIYRFRDTYFYLLSKWIIIVGMGCLGSLIGFLYAFQKVPIYTATTTFVLESGDKGGGSMGQYAGLASMVGVDIPGGGGGIFQGDNLLELYKSRRMIEKTLLSPLGQKTGKLVIDRYIEINKLRLKWAQIPGLATISFSDRKQSPKTDRLRDSIIGTIVNDINLNYLKVAKLDKKLSLIKVDVRATDEYFAKSFNDLIVYNVNEFYVRTKTKNSLDNVNILQHKTDSVRAVMNGAIYASATVADATPNMNITRQVQRIAPMQRSQFSAESSKAVLSFLIQNLEMSKMTLLQETPLIQVVDSPVFPLEKDRLSKAKAMIIGGLSLGFLAIVLLIIRKIISSILA